MAKLPAIMLYTGDWLKDPKLSMCSPLTRGIWIDAICAMHESDRSGSLTGTPDQLARVLRCAPSEVNSAIAELRSTGAADIRESNGLVTLVNRRMQRDAKERLAANQRVKKHRCNGDATDGKHESNAPSSYSPSFSVSNQNTDARGSPDDSANGSLDNPESAARSFSRNWISAECPQYLKRACLAPFERLILAHGKERAVEIVKAAMKPGVSNPFAYAEAAADGRKIKQEMMPRQRSVVGVREDR